ncbi:MAG TPA: Lpg1974 family pore-forming outer membrane protein, partial [Gemmataceae bacterium]|nr:Lpg1974 family pore-forming outer membrane protein [Gemmataceae bacterium]
MNRQVRGLPLLRAAALAACLACPAFAQSPPSAPEAVPAGPASPPPAPPPLSPIDSPPPPDPLPNHDTLLDTPAAGAGLFGAVEADIVKPHLSNRLLGPAFFEDGTYDLVQLPAARLDWTVAPRFELGYRMGDGLGEFTISYRFLDTDGKADLANFDLYADNPAGLLKTRLSMDVIDFDYGTPEIPIGSDFALKGRLGVRLADVYFDSSGLGEVTYQRTSNRFIGAGPHATIDGWYQFRQLGFGAFARVEGALPVGDVRQHFEESFVFSDGSAFVSDGTQHGTRWVPTVNAQLGLGWAPPGTRLRFSAGYEYEQWWYVGHVGLSRAQLFG